MMESTISSPSLMRMPPKDCATRLMPSVDERVNVISSTAGAFRKARTASRASSYASVAVLER